MKTGDAQRRLLAGLAVGACALVAAATAAPVTSALDRPAVTTRQASSAVLLGAVQAGARTVAVGERGIVLLSDDEGSHWRQAPLPVSVTLTAVRFADAQHGMAVGHGGTVLTTADAGETWVRRLDGRRLAQIALEAARASGDAQRIKEAELLIKDGPDKPLLDAVMLDAQRLLVVGAYGIALYSADGGEHWAPWMARLDNPRALHLYTVRQRAGTLLIAGEQGLLLHSADGGVSFKRIELPYKGSFFTAELLGDTDWLVAGLRGNAWRSRDAGASWAQVATPMPASITASVVDRAGVVWAANQAGFVLRLQGDAFIATNRAPLPPLSGLMPAASGRLMALGIAGAVLLPAADAASAKP